MCGIAGIWTRTGPADRAALERAAYAIAHRGPDEGSIYVRDGHGLVHSRLSIIDLQGGSQPLRSADEQLVLVANGEIYNYVELREQLQARGHRFATASDCETILHAYAEYGLDCLQHLHGMFAFALIDRVRKRCLLARDRLGIKPLFVARLTRGIAFASEIKALLPLIPQGPRVDAAGLAQYLQSQFSTRRRTPLAGIERVLPGEMITIDADGIVQRRCYWSAADVQAHDMDFEQAAEHFDGLMATVMREHLRADVPVGLFLSGGVDSAVLLAMIRRYSEEPLTCFSLGFPAASRIDELPTATALAKQFSSEHRLIEADRDAMFRRLPLASWAADDLMQDYANLPTAALAQAAGAQLKVVFTGEGGDEVFAGYGRYRMSALERGVRAVAAPGSGGFRTRGVFRGSWPRRLFGEPLQRAGARWRQPFKDAWHAAPPGWSAVQRMQYTDLRTALPDNLLVKVDRMLMAYGVEGRVPFLDHRIVEFGLSLPDSLKLDRHQGKTFLKRWAERYLPHDVLWRRKRGFHVPVGQWLGGAYFNRIADALPRNRGIRDWFRPAGIERLLAAHRSSGRFARPVWTLMQFAIWHKLFIDGDGRRPAELEDPVEAML